MNREATVPTPTDVRIIVQARMSSERFPGKALAPFRGAPLVRRVLEGAADAFGREHVVLATSDAPADDPLALYAMHNGYTVFRGPHHDVYARYRACLENHPCTHFVRICADSPLLDPALVRHMHTIARDGPALDLVTNTLVRTFPKGRSVEVVRTDTFLRLASFPLTAAHREHVTGYYYDRPERFRIHNVVNERQDPTPSLAVDTLDDLRRIEQYVDAPSLRVAPDA